MGLDQYAYTKFADERIYIQDWRKHNALEGFMSTLYVAKGGKEIFNCQDVEITSSDLSNLTVAVANDDLPTTAGFFFGNDTKMCPYNKEKTIEFIRIAKEALDDGQRVYYYSSW